MVSYVSELIVSPSVAKLIADKASGIYETIKDFYGRELRSLYHRYANPFYQFHIAEIIGTFLRVVSPYTTFTRGIVIRNIHKFISLMASMDVLPYISASVAYVADEYGLIKQYENELNELNERIRQAVDDYLSVTGGSYRDEEFKQWITINPVETENMRFVPKEMIPSNLLPPDMGKLDIVACLKETYQSYRYLELIRAINMGVFDDKYFNWMINKFADAIPCKSDMLAGVINRALSALHTGLTYIIGEGILRILRYTGKKGLLATYYNTIKTYEIGYEQPLYSGTIFSGFLDTVKTILDQVIGDIQFFENIYPLLVTSAISDFYSLYSKYVSDELLDEHALEIWFTYVNGVTIGKALSAIVKEYSIEAGKYNIFYMDAIEDFQIFDILPAPGMIYYAKMVKESRPFCPSTTASYLEVVR